MLLEARSVDAGGAAFVACLGSRSVRGKRRCDSLLQKAGNRDKHIDML